MSKNIFLSLNARIEADSRSMTRKTKIMISKIESIYYHGIREEWVILMDSGFKFYVADYEFQNNYWQLTMSNEENKEEEDDAVT